MRGHAVALLLLACVSQAGDGEWERLGEREGIVIERRSVGPSSIRELRLTARSPVPPVALMASTLGSCPISNGSTCCVTKETRSSSTNRFAFRS